MTQTTKVRVLTTDTAWGARHGTPTGTVTDGFTEYTTEVIITERRPAPTGRTEMVFYTYPGPFPKDAARHGFALAKRVVS